MQLCLDNILRFYRVARLPEPPLQEILIKFFSFSMLRSRDSSRSPGENFFCNFFSFFEKVAYAFVLHKPAYINSNHTIGLRSSRLEPVPPLVTRIISSPSTSSKTAYKVLLCLPSSFFHLHITQCSQGDLEALRRQPHACWPSHCDQTRLEWHV